MTEHMHVGYDPIWVKTSILCGVAGLLMLGHAIREWWRARR